MGRPSKFSFPIPGRKHSSNKDQNNVSAKHSAPSGHTMSKAQRILGTDNDLNIDSPNRTQDAGWEYSSSKSSAMSISISESSRSTNENESIHSSHSRQWDLESGVFPRPPQRLDTKASSTVLGNRHRDDSLTSASSITGSLRNEDSSSTLKSYYDPLKSPLAISQQTSASSARDLALRKGYSPAMHRSPLLQVQTPSGSYESQYTDEKVQGREQDAPFDTGLKKKHSKLDLSRLFGRSRHHGEKASEAGSITPSSISMSTDDTRMPAYPNSEIAPKTLKKTRSRESIQSQNHSVQSAQSRNPEKHKTNGTLLQLYENYELLPSRPNHMGSIPETEVLEPRGAINVARFPQPPRMTRTQDLYSPSIDDEPFSWKNVRASKIPSPWETSSATSVSSRNTKTSRRTGSSTMSHSDLKQKSVLSLSSGSESDDDDEQPEPMRPPNKTSNSRAPRPADIPSQQTRGGMRSTSQQAEGSTIRSQGHRDSGISQHSQFLELPKSTPASSRLSGPWAPPPPEMFEPQGQKQTRRMSTQREQPGSHRPPSTPSIASKRSSQEPTPPLSPSSVEFRQTSDRSSRFMAVTKQEEALLEALRQKRARMREAIIEEHETAKSPPRAPPRSSSRISAASSISTIRGAGTKQRVLLYLDTPISETQSIDTAEPSPDLSDFLSFGSDDESTPRASWATSKKGQPRPDSIISPRYLGEALSPMTPPSAARISAVGVRNGFKRQHMGLLLETKKRSTGVRFADDAKNEAGFSVDEDENERVWGM